MNALTRFVLGHKRLVVGFWLVVTIAAFAAIGPAGSALSQEFSVPGREGFETNQELAAIYGNGGDVAPIVPVVTLPRGTTVDSPGVARQLDAALAKVEAALPDARIASYASTGDRAFVSDDGRTTFALVYIPAKGGVDPGQAEARRAQAALAGVTVGGSPVEVTGLDALRAAAGDNDGNGAGRPARDAAGGARRAARPGLRLPLVHGDRAAADGGGRDPDDLPARLAARQRHRRLGHRPVPRRARRARHRDRLRAARRRALARGAPAAGRRRTRTAVRNAMQHAGSAVVFSGTTVAISLLALLALPVPFLRSIGIAGMLIALVSVAVAITLLPVVLATVGPRLDWPRNRRDAAPAAAGRPGPASSCATAGSPPRASDRRAGRARRRRLLDPARQPARRLARPVGARARRPREARGLGHRHRARSRRSTRSCAQAIPTPSPTALAEVDGVQQRRRAAPTGAATGRRSSS